jgi:starch synthase
MRILMVAAEAAPLAKVGGLADVVGSLPRALLALGHEVRVVIPAYGSIDWPRHAPRPVAKFPVFTTSGQELAEIWETAIGEIPAFLVGGPPIPKDRWIYGRSIQEDGPKFVFFSLAALWSAEAVHWKPDVVHAHDSHTGAAIWWLATEGRENPYFRDVASVFTIHNLPYAAQGAGQFLGSYKLRSVDAIQALPEAFRDSLMGLGILGADMLSTVSPTYAREILTGPGGHGLDGLLRLRQDRLAGILNGIDTDSWNPSTDPDIARNFDAGTLPHRAQNKGALQEEAGLDQDERMPLLGVVSRLVKEKGFDIAAPAVRRWLDRGGQFVLLGTGDPTLEHEFSQFEMRYPRRDVEALPTPLRLAIRPPDLCGRGCPAHPLALRAVRPRANDRHALRLRSRGAADGRPRRHGHRRRGPRRDRPDVRRVSPLGALGRARENAPGVRSTPQMGAAPEQRYGSGFLLGEVGDGVCRALRAGRGGARCRIARRS